MDRFIGTLGAEEPLRYAQERSPAPESAANTRLGPLQENT
jgi:hypothetical protein